MTRCLRRRGRSTTATIALLAMVALAGCGATATGSAAGGDGDAMYEEMFDADWALDGTAEALLDAGYELGRLTARFEPCSGRSYRFVYRTSVVAPGGEPFDAAAVESLGDELAAAGWEDLQAAPPDTAAEAEALITASEFEFAEVSLVVDIGDDTSALMLTLATECAEVTDREIELFEVLGEFEPVRRLPDSSTPPSATTG